MASTTLFAPSIRAVQPAFVYKDGTGTCTVYFTLNYNQTKDVYGIRYTLIDPNKSAVNGLNSMVQADSYHQTNETSPSAGTVYYTESGGVYTQADEWAEGTTYYIKGGNYLYPSSYNLSTAEQSFDIEFNTTEFKELTVNQFYQIQIELKDSSGNWSLASQTSLIRPINTPSIEASSARSRKLLFELKPSIETIREYSYVIINNDNEVFSKPITINLLGSKIEEEIPYYFDEDANYSIKLTCITKHGYKFEPTIDYEQTKVTLYEGTPVLTLVKSDKNKPNPRCNLESGSLDFALELFSDLTGKTVGFQRADEFSDYKNWVTAAQIKLPSIPDNSPYSVTWQDVHAQARTKYKYRLLWEGIDNNNNPVFYYSDFIAYQKTKDKEGQADKIYYSYDETNKIYTQYNDAFASGETYYEAQLVFIVDYEDIFLSDTTSMLAIRYNPKIANYKWVTQDSITNTLGGKYPIIRRNGDQSYRQFTLSGTIYLDWSSSTMEDCSLRGVNMSQFLYSEKCSFYLTPLAAVSYARDISKRRVLAKRMRELATQFLSNGSIKLFRSGEEETMIVYLSNVSFTPNAVSGRHIYDFSATVTEICEATPENIVRFGFGSNMEIIYSYKYFLYAADDNTVSEQISSEYDSSSPPFFTPYVNVEDIINLDNGNHSLRIYAELTVGTITNVGEVS